MTDLGLDFIQNEEEVDYDMEGQVFFDAKLKELTNYNHRKTAISKDVQKENAGFDSLMAECNSLISRKTNIMQL